MSSKSSFEPPTKFSFDPKDWPQWKQQWETFHFLTNLTKESEEYQIKALVYTMGPRALEIQATFTLSDTDKKVYDKILEAFNVHLIGTRNVIYERAMFGSRNQQEGESIEEFVTALHTMSLSCEYRDLREELVRDRLILGIKDKQVSKKLMVDSKLTLAKAVELARLSEQVTQQHDKLLTSSELDAASTSTKQNRSSLRSQRNASKTSNSELPPQNKNSSIRTCSNCGGEGHTFRQRDKCPAADAECFKCKRIGHYAEKCRSKEVKEVTCDKPENPINIFTVNRQSLVSRKTRRTEMIKLNGVLTAFKLDTGADVTCIPFNIYQRHFHNAALHVSTIKLQCPAGRELQNVGTFSAKLCIKNNVIHETIHVVRGLQRSLLGLAACEDLHLVQRVNRVGADSVKEVFTKVLPKEEFPKLFHGLGMLEQPYSIKLREGAEPFAVSAARRVPLPLMTNLKEKLEEMVNLGVISPVDEPTAWCAPMVIAGKPNGKIRICVDLTKLNINVERELHPMPVVEQELAQLNGAKFFSKVDANSGFWQIPLSDDSKPLTTFITPFGRYMFNRLPFGISSAPEHYQKRMSQILQGLEGVICHMDDFLIFAENQENHDVRLRRVLERLQKSGITLNEEKCIFGVQNIRFLGHRINAEGIQADDSKIKAIVDMPPPTNVTEVRRFLGLAQYLGRFVPHLADIAKPLNDLRSEKVNFIWGPPQQQAFEQVKKVLASDQVLATYDVNKPTRVSSDSSSYGLGATLKQLHEDTWRPVAFASRTLTKTEKGYAQIEKEALGITWACERFRDFIIGKRIEVETDHKPLVPIFSTKEIHDLTPRLQRFRMRMMNYSFVIFHTPGKDLVAADAFSRSPLPGHLPEDEDLQTEVEHYVREMISFIPTSDSRLQEIATGQHGDTLLKTIVSYTINGWPEKKDLTAEEKPYYEVRDELGEENGLLMKGERIVIPFGLRKSVLERLHEGHLGITKCRSRARETVWWPGISEQIADLINACETFIEHRAPHHQPLLPTELPERPWQKIAMDLCQHNGKDFLVVIDYFSRYPEVAQLTSLSSQAIVDHSRAIFGRHGIPDEVVTDNGPQFRPTVTSAFTKFAKEYKFIHTTSSPKFPQSNGMAEAAVKIIKSLYKKGSNPVTALMEYRATPLANGYSPAELLMGRKIKTTVPICLSKLQPKIVDFGELRRKEEKQRSTQKDHFDKRHGAREKPTLAVGEKVWVTDQRAWGTVIGPAKTPRSFIVKTATGTFRRNSYHLSSSGTFADPTEVFADPEFEDNSPTPDREVGQGSPPEAEEQPGAASPPPAAASPTPRTHSRYGRQYRKPVRYRN